MEGAIATLVERTLTFTREMEDVEECVYPSPRLGSMDDALKRFFAEIKCGIFPANMKRCRLHAFSRDIGECFETLPKDETRAGTVKGDPLHLAFDVTQKEDTS